MGLFLLTPCSSVFPLPLFLVFAFLHFLCVPRMTALVSPSPMLSLQLLFPTTCECLLPAAAPHPQSSSCFSLSLAASKPTLGNTGAPWCCHIHSPRQAEEELAQHPGTFHADAHADGVRAACLRQRCTRDEGAGAHPPCEQCAQTCAAASIVPTAGKGFTARKPMSLPEVYQGEAVQQDKLRWSTSGNCSSSTNQAELLHCFRGDRTGGRGCTGCPSKAVGEQSSWSERGRGDKQLSVHQRE